MNLPRVYFYCSSAPDNLQEDVIQLAEGLVELGIPFYANCSYWLQSTAPADYLFKHDPNVTHRDCDIVVVSYTWPFWVKMRTWEIVRTPLPAGLFEKGRRYATVYMDNHDGQRTISWEPEFRQFDLILRTKLNGRAWHPENMRAWAYGLTNRIVDATSGALPFASRKKALLVNFNVSHPTPHGTRMIARRKFEPKIDPVLPVDRTIDDLSHEPSAPYDALMWNQTGGRFSRNYYERLKRTQAVACFCGEIIPPMPFRDPQQYLWGGNRAKAKRAFFGALSLFDPRPPRSVQWDSFRFWEALSAGCAAINIDLEHYGVEMPVMPRNRTHYLGIDFARVEEFVQMVRDDPALLERVADEGRRWAHRYYSPKAAAERFLGLFGYDVANAAPTGATVDAH